MRVFIVLAIVALTAVAVSADISSTGGSGVGGTSICDKLVTANGGSYASYADVSNALNKLVSNAATNSGGANVGFFNDPQTTQWFNGVKNYRQQYPVAQPRGEDGSVAPNYVANSAQASILVGRLVGFLAQPSALYCTLASSFPYSSVDMKGATFNQWQIHANMNVTSTAFSAFNAHVSAAANGMKLDTDSQNKLKGFLGSFGRTAATVQHNIDICWDATLNCPCADTTADPTTCMPQGGNASSVSVSFVALLIAAFVTVVAMRR